MSDTLERVKKIIAERMEIDISKISADSDIMNDLGADSLDLVELVMAFEEEFSIEIPDDAQEKSSTVGDIVKQIATQIDGQA